MLSYLEGKSKSLNWYTRHVLPIDKIDIVKPPTKPRVWFTFTTRAAGVEHSRL